MILARLLSKELLELGITSIYSKRDSLQRIAVDVLVKELKLKEGEFQGKARREELGIRIISGKGEDRAQATLSQEGREILREFPKTPLFIIDLGFWNYHSEKEKKRLYVQLLSSVDAIRRYLWDYNLSLNHSPFKLTSIPNKVRYDVKPSGKAIVLNPYGDVVATEELLRSADTFILGGIVDESGWKGATTALSERFGYDFPQVRIELRGSRVGVPDRINKIIEIIMEVREGKSLEEAIIDNQSSADKYLRILRDGNPEETGRWLRASEKVIKRAKRILSRTQPGSSSSPQ
ncbi:MAG: tRNA (guanine-N1)-methyltransferase [Candidatus Aramenus sp.]|nr:tRNA (guanine-N1)-methyltransferase [Candidatus Aramenus sp.]